MAQSKRMSKLAFRIGKTRDFLLKIARSKRALFGICILVLYSSIAIFADHIAPFNPVLQTELSGKYNAPLWYAQMTGTPHSENVVPIMDPYLNSPDSISEWNINTSGQQIAVTWVNYTGDAKSFIETGPQNKPGCMLLNLTGFAEGATTATVTISKTFNYIYPANPARFTFRLSYLADGVETTPVHVTVYAKRQSVIESIENESVGNGNGTATVFKLSAAPVLDSETISIDGTIIQRNIDYQLFSNGTIIFATPPPVNANILASYQYYKVTPGEFLIYDKLVGSTTEKWEPLLVDSDMGKGWVRTYFGSDNADPISIIFRGSTDYTITFRLDFENLDSDISDSDIYIDSMYFKLYGTAFGLLGTDQFGRDIFSQLMFGARISLFVGLLSAFLGVVLGLTFGLVSGYVGGLVDEVVMRFTDVLLVLPGLPLILVLMVVLGQSIWNLIILIGFLGWMGFARTVRSMVLTLKERPFIESAKAAGAGTGYIIVKHIVPNVMVLVYVTLATSVPTAILSEAALSFLGLFDASVMTWGRMLHDAETSTIGFRLWWWVLPPGLSIALVSLSFILLGFALDEILNPRLRARR